MYGIATRDADREHVDDGEGQAPLTSQPELSPALLSPNTPRALAPAAILLVMESTTAPPQPTRLKVGWYPMKLSMWYVPPMHEVRGVVRLSLGGSRRGTRTGTQRHAADRLDSGLRNDAVVRESGRDPQTAAESKRRYQTTQLT